MTGFSKITSRIVLTGLVIATGFAANAATDGGEGKMKRERPSFSMLDTDNNGELTPEELAAHGKARFDKQDTNGDGKLSKEEMTSTDHRRAQKRADRMIERMDADKDGAVSFEEMTSGKRQDRMAKMFERIDADGNGSLSEDEFAKMEKGRGGFGQKMRRGHSD